MSLIESFAETRDNPLAMVESMALRNDWSFERSVEDEIAIGVAGKLVNYQVSFTWMDAIRVLHFACAFEVKIPEPRLAEIQRLVARINEQMWIGHFEIWSQDGTVMFRHSLLLDGGVRGGAGQGTRGLRTLLSGIPVRDLGGKIGARGHGCRHVRYGRRGVTGPFSALASCVLAARAQAHDHKSRE
jgi:hypothetical protein